MNPSKIWFFNSLWLDQDKQFSAGDTVDVQIMRTGERKHQLYWKVKVSEKTINDVVTNFEENKRGIDLAVDENHEPNHKALARFRKLYKKWEDALFATVELTKKGAELMTDWAYKYFSPEIVFWPMKDEESGETLKNLLTGGAFTNRPFFKNMDAVSACEATEQQQKDNILYVFSENSMDKFNELLEACKTKNILSFSEKFELQSAFNDLSDEQKTDEVQQEVAEQVEKPETEEKKEDKTPSDEGDKTPEPVKASEITPEMYNEQQKEIALMSAKLKRNEVEKEFNENFAFNDQNKDGILNANKHKDSFVDFVVTLNDDQKSKFYEIVWNIDTTLAGKFSEIWSGKTPASSGSETFEQKYHEAVEKISKDQKVSYAEAAEILNQDSKKYI